MAVLVTCKFYEAPIKNEVVIDRTTFPIISQWELSVAMETRVFIRSAPQTLCSLPPTPMMFQIKFDQAWPPEIFKFKSVDDGRTPDHCYTMSSPCELIIPNNDVHIPNSLQDTRQNHCTMKCRSSDLQLF